LENQRRRKEQETAGKNTKKKQKNIPFGTMGKLTDRKKKTETRSTDYGIVRKKKKKKKTP
jgi:hypothetical protein